MKEKYFFGAVVAAVTIGSASVATAALSDAQLQEFQQRMELVNQMTRQFQSDAAAQAGRGFSAAEWKRDFGSRLLYQSSESLRTAVTAPNLTTAQGVFSAGAGKGPAKHSADDNLLMHMLSTPCRIADTRGAAAGIMPGGQWRGFSVMAPAATIAAQGGAAGGCPLPVGVEAFVLLVTVVPTGSPGSGGANFLTVQHGAAPTPPTTASMTYYPGTIISEFAMSLCSGGCPTGASGGVEVYTSNSTHVIIDWIGWMGHVEPVALQCQTLSANVVIPSTSGSSFTGVSPSCAAGYTLTGGGFDSNYSTAEMWFYESGPEGTPADHWRCRGRNPAFTSFIDINANCKAICCRVPQLGN